MSQSTDSGSRGSFSGRIGFVLAVAGSAVGLGNIWRFPYLAAKYGGGTFLLVYLILLVTFGFALIMAEITIGRKTRLSPIGAYKYFCQEGKHTGIMLGGWINAIVPMIILPYYCVIGGWVIKYLIGYLSGQGPAVAEDGYFGSFISSSWEAPAYFMVFFACTSFIVLKGVDAGVERASRLMMPLLLLLGLCVAIYSMTRPGASEGIYYYLVPDFSHFSIMTVVAACGQLFFSLSIAMGILITYGSYMKKDVDAEQATSQIEIVDTLVAMLAGFMIIPAVFAFSGADAAEHLNAGPSLMFITIPKVFASMGMGSVIGFAFFLMVFFAALTSSVSILEACVSTVADETHWSRTKCILVMSAEAVVIGVPCALGFGPLGFIQLAGMSILDMLDFLSCSVLMPIAAIATCFLVTRVIGLKEMSEEIKRSSAFKREAVFRLCITWLAPAILIIILVSSIGSALGLIKI
ncbi:sodium-dependent transporter [uncultured Mailhella sp.]|uniref:sodium-dependent transporter n=1 Tax=uncultured Mailhella sp. TaxID=1981031 RepID=UPI00262F4D27|nr:sodium-dependent transporter [uncultured Mailhella sp.]